MKDKDRIDSKLSKFLDYLLCKLFFCLHHTLSDCYLHFNSVYLCLFFHHSCFSFFLHQIALSSEFLILFYLKTNFVTKLLNFYQLTLSFIFHSKIKLIIQKTNFSSSLLHAIKKLSLEYCSENCYVTFLTCSSTSSHVFNSLCRHAKCLNIIFFNALHTDSWELKMEL